MSEDYDDIMELGDVIKAAFVQMTPEGPVAPQDPAMAGGGMPPVDPATGMPMEPAMMGGMPPMDPAMAAGGGMPMDPAMAAGGGMPMDPAMMGGMPPMDPAMMDPAMAGGDPAAAVGEEPPMDPAAEDEQIKQMISPIIKQVLSELGIEPKEKKVSPKERMDSLEAQVAGIAEKLGVPAAAAKIEEEEESGMGGAPAEAASPVIDAATNLPAANYAGPASMDPAFIGGVGTSAAPGLKQAACRVSWDEIADLAVKSASARRV